MSGHVIKARVDHREAARQARQMPGQWVLAGMYSSGASAMSASLQVRTGERVPAYRPAGSFRARTEVTQEGADLWVCYVAPTDQDARDYQASLAAGLTETLDDFSHRLGQSGNESAATAAGT